jgi:hypothetical protein
MLFNELTKLFQAFFGLFLIFLYLMLEERQNTEKGQVQGQNRSAQIVFVHR